MKTREIIICATVAALFSSCESSFLDEKQVMSLTGENMYQTTADFDLALTGVYDMLGTRNYQTLQNITNYYANYNGGILLLNELGTDEMYCVAQGGVKNQPRLEEMDKYVFPATNDFIAAVYAGQYAMINRANDLLAHIDAPISATSSDSTRVKLTRIKAQALFLRALCYYNLVSIYGGVPKIDRPGSEYVSVKVPRAPVQEIYQMIVDDLTFAWQNLPDAFPEVCRATRAAAGGLLARVDLTIASMARHAVITGAMKLGSLNSFDWVDQEKFYKQALAYADSVIQIKGGAGVLASMPFEQSFYHYENTPDVLFDVQFAANQAQEEGGWVGWLTGPGSWNWISLARNVALGMAPAGDTTSTYASMFPSSPTKSNCDMRKVKTVSNWAFRSTLIAPLYSSTWPPAGNSNWIGANGQQKIFTLAKFAMDATRDYPNQATPVNYVIMRLSEMYLIYAEAENELNLAPTKTAYDMINAARRRAADAAVLPDYNDTNICDEDSFNKFPTIALGGADLYNNFRLKLLLERKWELCGESVRKVDLIRSGWMAPILDWVNRQEGDAVYRQRAFKDYQIFYPMPSREVTISNGTVVQNYGY